MKDKILEIVEKAMDKHLDADIHSGLRGVFPVINGMGDCMGEISAELDRILPIELPKLYRTKGTSTNLSEEDIAKLEACGFIYDKERNLMIQK